MRVRGDRPRTRHINTSIQSKEIRRGDSLVARSSAAILSAVFIVGCGGEEEAKPVDLQAKSIPLRWRG